MESTVKLTTSDKFLFTGQFHEKWPAVSKRRLRSFCTTTVIDDKPYLYDEFLAYLAQKKLNTEERCV